MFRKGITFLLLVMVVGGLFVAGRVHKEDLSQLVPPAGKYDVRILRDMWGLPHLFGKRDVDAAYGLGFAHSEDDWIHIEEAVLLSRAQMASVRGKDWAKFDYLAHLFKIRTFVDQKYEKELGADTRAVVEAYADGITHFAALNREKMPHIALPVTGKDIVAGGMLKVPFFYDLQAELIKVLGGKQIGRDGRFANVFDSRNSLSNGEEIGSNAWAVGTKRSADGATRLAINSHMPWSGPVTWYEAHLHSEEGWNMVGATFPGGPMVFKGHDENKGWCHTINRPDLADVYALELNPANKNQYKLDGQWHDFETKTVRIGVKLWGPFKWTFKRELRWSVHGPVLETEKGTFAVRFAGYGEVRQIEQWYRMNKARNFDEFLDAMRVDGLVSLNTLYADKAGNLYYAYVGHFPVRAKGYDWKGTLPGNTSKTIWTEQYPFEKIPQVKNPPSGFIVSCNNSPFQTTDGEGNPRPEDFPCEMGIETGMTNRALRAFELYGADPAISREAFYRYKYDKTYSEKSFVNDYLRELFAAPLPDDSLAKQAVALLKTWDRSTDKRNTLAALGVLASEPYAHWARFNDCPKPDVVKLLQHAAHHLQKTFGRLEIPWEDMLRLRHGKVDLGLGGGPDCLRAVDVRLEEDGRYVGVNGDCYFLMVEWDKDGKVHSEAVHQYGAATVDPHSPHFTDQAPLFVREETRPTLLDEADIRAHLEREYRPGDFRGAWWKK